VRTRPCSGPSGLRLPACEIFRKHVLLERLAEARAALEQEIGRRVVGQHAIVEGLLTALLADGHALLVGVPGLAKTLLVRRWRTRWSWSSAGSSSRRT
jgi:hypothetical protein